MLLDNSKAQKCLIEDFVNYKNLFDKIDDHFLVKEEYFKKIYLEAF